MGKKERLGFRLQSSTEQCVFVGKPEWQKYSKNFINVIEPRDLTRTAQCLTEER